MFATNSHLIIFEMIYKSYETLPIGSFANLSNLVERALYSSDIMFKMAIVISLPIVSILVSVMVLASLRSLPQLNLFSFGFPLTILGTFALYFSVDAIKLFSAIT